MAFGEIWVPFCFEEIIWKNQIIVKAFGEIKTSRGKQMNALAEGHFFQTKKRNKERKNNDFDGTEENIY